MRRRVELERAHYTSSTLSSRNVENTTRDWCKIDEVSRNKMAKERLLRERLELQEAERRVQREQAREQSRVQQDAEREKAAQLIAGQRQATCDKKLRQKLREECEDLRLLEQQLRAAYVAKENSCQIGEKRTRQLQEKVNEERERQVLEQQRLAALKEEEIKAEQSWKEKEELRKCLQQQMTETFNRKRVKYEEFIREKEWIDEITSRLQEEQVQEVEMKMRRIQEASLAIEHYRQDREKYRLRQKKLNEEENKRMIKFLHEKKEQERLEAAKREAQIKEKTALADKLSKQLDAIENEARKREELMVELNIKELAEREEKRLRKQLEEQLRKRVQVRVELEKQREFIWIRQQQNKEEDRLFKEDQMRILAENDRLELLSNEMRRRKQAEHRKAVDELLELRRKRKIEKLDQAKSQHDEELKEAKRIREMIEEERIKILQEHAQELIGFLPAGILRESDAQQLPLPTKSIVIPRHN